MLMVILIGFSSGITSINAEINVAGAHIEMILFGWLWDRMNPPRRTSTTMLSFWIRALVGITRPLRASPSGEGPREARGAIKRNLLGVSREERAKQIACGHDGRGEGTAVDLPVPSPLSVATWWGEEARCR